MNNIYVWLILVVVSVIFSIYNRIAVFNEKSIIWWLFEVWRDFVSFFMTGVIGYFLVAIRWPIIEESGNLSVSDYILFMAFFIGVLGWWPYIIKNISEGIGDILGKILKKKEF